MSADYLKGVILSLCVGFAFVACANEAWYLEKLNVPALHAKGITGKGVKVGVVDCGLHGIGVKSIIGSKRIGIAPDCEILYRSTSDSVGSTLKGMWYCATNGCQVINMSFGFNIITATPEMQKNFEDEMRKIVQRGVILVCGNGNNEFNEYIECPAVVRELISVGGVTRDEKSATLKKNLRMDFCAYGIDVPMEKNDKGDLRKDSGTSFATPMVTGVVALLLQQNPKLTRDEVYDILKRNVKKLADGKNRDFGWGLVQACEVPTDYRRQAEIDAERAKHVPLESARLTNSELTWNPEKKRYELTLPAGAEFKFTYESFPENASDRKLYWHCGNLTAVNRVLEDDVLRMKDSIPTVNLMGKPHRMNAATIQGISSDFKQLVEVFVKYAEP